MITYQQFLQNTRNYEQDKNGWPRYIGIQYPENTDHIAMGYRLLFSSKQKATYYIYAGHYQIEVTRKEECLTLHIPQCKPIRNNIVVLTKEEFIQSQHGYYHENTNPVNFI